MIPLSTRMRPENLESFVGQEHFLKKGSLFFNSIKNKNFNSAIFYGHSGTGKTSLARIIAYEMDQDFIEINASATGTKELKNILWKAESSFNSLMGKPLFLYIDEFHRWSKLQQDSLLKALEEGIIKFIGSTTENPYFSINNAVISRVRNIYEFKKLSLENIQKIIKNCIENREKGLGNLSFKYEDDGLRMLAEYSNGDARVALDTLGFIVENMNPEDRLNEEKVEEALQRKVGFYHREDDKYDLLSALQKSIRGSDPDASIHYFARLIDGGTDIVTIGRRLMIMASEDIGMAYPGAISVVTSCVRASQMVGLPEAGIILAEAVILLASSPKSNKSYEAFNTALNDLHNKSIDQVPNHLRDSHYQGAKAKGYGKEYLYPHNYGGYVEQNYLPENLLLEGTRYYFPTNNGAEKGFAAYLNGLKNIKNSSENLE
ncbi:replication-associated recombination protein A [Eubacteriales bacterium KG127]